MSTGRILVVDDEPQIRRVMRVALSCNAYMVADARSGEDALEKLREEKFDLVLLDVNLPGISGIAACREIRARSDVPVIVLTVRNSSWDTVAALDAGADDYVTYSGYLAALSQFAGSCRTRPVLQRRSPYKRAARVGGGQGSQAHAEGIRFAALPDF